jgi:hypothetical protein
MIQKLKRSLLVLVSMVAMFAPGLFMVAAPVAVSADINSALCEGTNAAANGGTQSGCAEGATGSATAGIKHLAAQIVNIFSIIVGIVAVIFIIYGGFKYITSGGDSGNVTTAKNTIIYAIIGLVIVALAQFIVHYVLNTAASLPGTST